MHPAEVFPLSFTGNIDREGQPYRWLPLHEGVPGNTSSAKDSAFVSLEAAIVIATRASQRTGGKRHA